MTTAAVVVAIVMTESMGQATPPATMETRIVRVTSDRTAANTDDVDDAELHGRKKVDDEDDENAEESARILRT